MKTDFAKTTREAEEMASTFFIENFGHSGKVGVEKNHSNQCACGESQMIEYYSKDDPGMDDTYYVTICEACSENN